jgi:phosphoribosylformylglycinamidine synthase PurS subunit
MDAYAACLEPALDERIVAAVQESIERTGDISQAIVRKIKDRFPVKMALSTLHIRALISERLVQLKPGLLDPQGKAVQGSLPAMGWTNVSDVRVGKHVALTVDSGSEEAARAQVEEMARRLLSNPVIEDFRILAAEQVGG